MAEDVVDRPSFDEYVVARGGVLLRTAWLLVGEDRAALQLVRVALARARPQWEQLAEHGAGSYDTDLRRFLVLAHLRRARHPGRADPADGADGDGATVDGGSASVAVKSTHPDQRQRVGVLQEALDSLTRVERVVVVLVLVDGLGEAQVADLLDDDVGSVRRHLLHGLARLRDGFGLRGAEVRDLVDTLGPLDVPVDLLLAPADDLQEEGPGRRWRGIRGWLFALAAVAVAALVVSLVTRPAVVGTPPPRPTTEPVPATLSCESQDPPAPPRPLAAPLGNQVVGVLACARTDDGSVWDGPLPPDAPITDPRAIDSLVLAPHGSGEPCPGLPRGPAFRLLLLGRDGATTTWSNEALACNGWQVLAQVYVATAEQAAAETPADAGFLGCPTALGQEADPTGAGPGLAKGTVLVEATACLHPLADGRPPGTPRYRAVRGNVLGAPDIAQLNADLARAGSRRTARGDCSFGPRRYVVRARTDTGRLVELSSICGREFAVDGHLRDSWQASPGTTSMLRALLVAN